MKAVFPKNIKKGLWAGLSISFGPISISIIQLFILAVGVAIAFVVFNKFAQTSKAAAVIFAILVVLIFLVIAFFEVSELNLLSFIMKFIQNNFFDTTEKYQNNFSKPNATQLLLEKNKNQENKQKIEYKTGIQLENIDQLDRSGILGKK